MPSMSSFTKFSALLFKRGNDVRKDAAFGASIELLVIALGVASPVGLKWAVDGLSEKPIEHQWVLIGIVAFILFWVATAVLGAITQTFTASLCDQLTRSMMTQALRAQLPLMAKGDDVDTGEFQGVFERLPYSLQTVVEGVLWRIVPLALQVAVTLLVVGFAISFKYAGVLLVILSAHALISFRTAESYERQAEIANDAAGAVSNALTDLLQNASRTVFNGALPQEVERVGQAAAEKRQQNLAMSFLLVKTAFLQYTAIGVGVVLLLIMGMYDVAAGGISVGDFVLLQAYTFSFATPIASYGFVIRQAGVAFANIEDAIEKMGDDTRASTAAFCFGLSNTPARIKAEDLRFKYRNQPAINGIDLEIPPGAFTVIVGPNGSGKSTFARLIAGILEPASGQIFIHDEKIGALSVEGRVLYVPQQVSLFDRSLEENGLYPPTSLQRESLRETLSDLAFYEDGREIQMDLQVGDRGSRLSGGQLQKLELARISHIPASAIVLDETTSALDMGGEQAAIELLRRHRRGASTVILISHRIFAAEQADLVIFMESGKISARGRHTDLMRADPRYKEFWLAADQKEPLPLA